MAEATFTHMNRSPASGASYSSDDLASLATERPWPRRQSVATVHSQGHHHARQERRPSRATMALPSVDRWAVNGGVERATLGHMESLSSERRRRKTCRESASEDEEEERRSRAVLVCASVAVALLLTAILLVAITLTMSPAIDEMVRKENEEILRELEEASSGGAGGSSSSAGLANGTVQAAA